MFCCLSKDDHNWNAFEIKIQFAGLWFFGNSRLNPLPGLDSGSNTLKLNSSSNCSNDGCWKTSVNTGSTIRRKWELFVVWLTFGLLMMVQCAGWCFCCQSLACEWEALCKNKVIYNLWRKNVVGLVLVFVPGIFAKHDRYLEFLQAERGENQ